MSEANLNEALSLLKKANSKGIRLHFSNNELVVKYSKDKPLDELFLRELKVHKQLLVDYFRNNHKTTIDGEGNFLPDEKIERNGKVFYQVSPMHVYWIDDNNKEFKDKLFGWVRYRITGELDIDSFRKAIYYLVEYHESLRSVFIKEGDRYYISAGDMSPLFYEVDYRDRSSIPGGEQGAEDFFRFKDHVFDVLRKPLMAVRLIRNRDKEFLLSIKLHHAIYDGWSLDVLLRDLLTAYSAYAGGGAPVLPLLTYQYKEYQGTRTRQIRECLADQERYWRSLYSDLPGPLRIPGDKGGMASICRTAKVEDFHFAAEMLQSLAGLSRRYEVSLFVLLQAFFFLYLYKVTGQHDLVAGTMLFGRDHIAGAENQIGYYAYTDLIRVVLEAGDPLDRVVEKVKRANEDMLRYNAYILLGFLWGMNNDTGVSLSSSCWKVNLTYSDLSGYYVDRARLGDLTPRGLQIEPLPYPEPVSVTDLDIKVEFINGGKRMGISVTYDGDRYASQDIRNLITGFINTTNETLSLQ